MTAWVLLRGLIREQRHWGKFPEQLRSAFDHTPVITLDLPGNGTLHRESSPVRIEEMAQHCRQELLSRGLTPPYRVLALSLGAMVAVAWSTHYPQEIESCVLINTSLRPFSPFYRRLRPHNYARLLHALCVDTAQREKIILGLTSCSGDKQTALLDDWIAFQNEFPVSQRNALRQLFAAMRFRAPDKKPETNILLLGSTQDRLVDNRCTQELARRWQTDTVLHTEAGHDLPLDDGSWVVERVKSWIVHGAVV